MAQIINAVSSFIKNIAIHADTVAVAQIAEQGGAAACRKPAICCRDLSAIVASS
jgi:hypothetical protein